MPVAPEIFKDPPAFIQAIKGKMTRMGIELTQAGKCPRGASLPHACMFCHCGHMTECHYPKSCEEAQCSHLSQYDPCLDE
jgi:hypothetical protein